MVSGQRRYLLFILYAVLTFYCVNVSALEIEPGVGTAFEYTNNVQQVSSGGTGETVGVAYVGAKIVEDEGALNYNAQASFNRYKYFQDAFESSRYFNLIAKANWEVFKDRFNLNMSDIFTQRAIAVLGNNTPDNIQNSNAFILSGNLLLPVNARNQFTVTPAVSQFYFEIQRTNNKQYSLSTNWSYKMNRRTDIGLGVSTRNIDYTQVGANGQTIEDTRFTTLSLQLTRQSARSNFSATAGSTSVKREGGAETKGFSGGMNFSTELSSRSSFNTGVSTALTDTSTVSSGIGGGPPGNTVQVTTDVIRNSVFNASYQRLDATLSSSINLVYRKVDYSESPLDQKSKTARLSLGYPLTRQLSGNLNVSYDSTQRLDLLRKDEVSTFGGGLSYSFSAKLNGRLNLAYRERRSTFKLENFEETTVYLSLVYGFGQVYRPTRISTSF